MRFASGMGEPYYTVLPGEILQGILRPLSKHRRHDAGGKTKNHDGKGTATLIMVTE